jgi:hypothetical protein
MTIKTTSKELQFYLLFCLGVQHDLLHYGENVGCECLRAGW